MEENISLSTNAAETVKWILEKIAEGIFNAEQIYNMSCQKDFQKLKTTFLGHIRNPIYCGKFL